MASEFYQKGPSRGISRALPQLTLDQLWNAQAGMGEAAGIGDIQRQLMGLGGERQGLLQQLEGLQGITSISPQVQALAQQAAFAPLQGLQPALQNALLQASNAANQRGLSQSSIGAALQAQAVPQIMQPAMAQAQGRMGELLMQIPLQERQLGLQQLGMGSQLLEQGFQGAGMQQGLRESAFNQLQSAMAQSAQERQYQQSVKPQSLLKKIAGVGLGILGSAFLGPLGGMLGSSLGGMMGGGGRGGGASPFQAFTLPPGPSPSWGATAPQIPMQMPSAMPVPGLQF